MNTRYVRRKIVFALLGTVLTALVLSACAVDEPQPELVDPTGFVTYGHPSGAFNLSLPPDWVVSDTSDPYALNVAFSPPGYADPLVSVYVASTNILEGMREVGLTGFLNESGIATDFDDLVGLYQASVYTFSDATYKEIDRQLQPDGSLRVRFVIDAPGGAEQHNDFYQVIGSYFVALRLRLPNEGMPNAPAHMRTLGRVVNTLDVNPASGWASAVPEGGDDPTERDLIGFTSLNAWVARSGGFVIVGQVINNAPEPVEFVRLNATLFDTRNRSLIEQDDFVSSDLIQPGDYAPFSIVFSDGLPPDTARYELEVSARYAGFASQTFYSGDNFALTSQAEFDDSGALEVSGQVRNEGNREANLVKVIVTIFDDQRRVVATDTTLVDTQPLTSGESSTFSVKFFELGGDPNTFLVTAQGIITE